MQGDAKAQICEFCENESMDLLVVTSTIRGRLKKALSLMGGVSSQLVLEAPCPVLVLPTQASSKGCLPSGHVCLFPLHGLLLPMQASSAPAASFAQSMPTVLVQGLRVWNVETLSSHMHSKL